MGDERTELEERILRELEELTRLVPRRLAAVEDHLKKIESEQNRIKLDLAQLRKRLRQHRDYSH